MTIKTENLKLDIHLKILKMRAFLCLVLCVLTISAVPIEELVSGEDGWYIPQLNGTLQWMDKQVAIELMAKLELVEGRLDLNAVTFYLYTKSNPKKPQQIEATRKSVQASNFNPSKPTRFVIHGWVQSHTAEMYLDVRDAWLSKGDFNIIIVDWARGRSAEYVSSVLAIPEAGKKVGEMIKFLNAEFQMPLSTLHVIGHSLGAHVAGHAGKTVGNGKIHAIIGLDPAGPLFDYNMPSKRLASTDAQYVETVHTNGGKLGILRPVGIASFYVNGGEYQPGCGTDISQLCSHQRSVFYYTEAVSKLNFPAIKCSNYEYAVNNHCGSTYSSIRMSAPTNALSVSGIFYVATKSAAPFGLLH